MKKVFILFAFVFGLTSFAYAEPSPLTTAINPISISIPEKDLGIGIKSDDVKILQDILISKGYLSADANTGYFGAKTKVALMKLQKENGLSAVGKYGPATRAHFKKFFNIRPIGGDKDTHGCLIAAGYSWSTSTSSCVRPWEQATSTHIVGGQTDSYGCMLGAGYSWDKELSKCVRPWEKVSQMLTRDWVLKTIDGQNYNNLTFKVVDGSVSARACNTIFGKIKIDDVNSTVSAPILASTMMACSDNGLMYQDTVLSQTLVGNAKVAFDFNANPVTMTIVGGNHTLVFTLK